MANVRAGVVALLLLLPGVSRALDLVTAGQPASVLVVPDEALPAVSFAAEELREHVFLASGARLSVVKESEDRPDGLARIYLGGCRATQAALTVAWNELPHGTAVLRTVGDRLFLAGRDGEGTPLLDSTSAGSLFAVYELLERHLGVRWIWPGELGTVVPRQTTISLPALDLEIRPPFLHTRMRFGGLSLTPAGFSSLEARAAYADQQLRWLRRHRFNRGVSLEYNHGFEDYWERFGKSRPEYFNLLPDGTRRSDPLYGGGEGRLVAMCVSEPGLARERLQEWQQTRTPEQPWVNCAENDTCGKCTCARCLAWDVPGTIEGRPELAQAEAMKLAAADFAAGKADWYRWLGSLSDRYARFWLATQAEARRVDPEATILAYAYANYMDAPRQTVLNDHVIVAIVPGLMYPWTDAKREAFRTQWAGWAKAGARLYLRPNYTLDGHAFPIFYAHKLVEDFRFAAEHGLIATDFDSLTCQYGVQGPNFYALARLHEHPDWSFAQIMAEYTAAFGPAATAVEAYFAHWRAVSDQVTDERIAAAAQRGGAEGGSWSHFYLVADAIFTPPVMAQGRTLLEQARLAAAADPSAARRVAFLEKGLHHAELCLAVEQARRGYLASGNLPDYQTALAALDEFRSAIESECVIGPGLLRFLEASTWDRSLLTVLKQPGERLPGPWRFQFDPEKNGESLGWNRVDCADRDWPEIGIGSAWEQQAVGKQWEQEHGQGYNGLGWYRTRFSLKPARPGARVSLLFGAVDEACVIWLNGQQVLQRVFDAAKDPNSWQEAFDVDITPWVRYDQPNILAVRVEDNAGAGGIWRPVWAIQAEPVAPGAANLVPDGDFESAETAWKKHVAAGEFRFEIDHTVVHGGKASGRIDCLKPAEREPAPNVGTAWGRWYQTDLPVQTGKTYRLRAWVLTAKDFGGTANLWLRSAEGGDGPGNHSVCVLPTHGLWRQIEFDGIVAGGNTASVYLNLMGGAGSIWFDDVELVEDAPGKD
jgi:hypothetical protein